MWKLYEAAPAATPPEWGEWLRVRGLSSPRCGAEFSRVLTLDSPRFAAEPYRISTAPRAFATNPIAFSRLQRSTKQQRRRGHADDGEEGQVREIAGDRDETR